MNKDEQKNKHIGEQVPLNQSAESDSNSEQNTNNGEASNTIKPQETQKDFNINSNSKSL